MNGRGALLPSMSFLSSTNTSALTGQELLNDITVNNPPEDSISDVLFSPQQDLLAAALWDKKVRIYAIDVNTGQNQGRAMYEHDGPVFSARWSPDSTRVVLGGADKQVRLFDVALQQQTTIGMHDGAVRSVRYVECGPLNTPVVVLGSWDKTLRYWDTRQPQPVTLLQLGERVYAMDSLQKLLVVACAERQISIVDLNQPQQIFKNTMLPLKWQTRTVLCYPQGNGFAVGSIEGRCAIQYIDDAEQSKFGFLFRCHRKTPGQAGTAGVGARVGSAAANELHIYAVNLIAFHPGYGTFSTAGSDGTFCFWDKDAKQRLKAFPLVNASILATAFNSTGLIFAYAVSYDWSQGLQGNRPDYPNQIKLHGCKDEEIKQKKKR